jgi:hypothetical protein
MSRHIAVQQALPNASFYALFLPRLDVGSQHIVDITSAETDH